MRPDRKIARAVTPTNTDFPQDFLCYIHHTRSIDGGIPWARPFPRATLLRVKREDPRTNQKLTVFYPRARPTALGEYLSDPPVAKFRWIENNVSVPTFQVDRVNVELHRTSTNVRVLENSIRPFYRLHPDIIIEISKYLDPRACDNRYKPLLCASQISRSWRDTLISQPSLWSFISGSYPDLIPSLLDRSKHAELDVHVTSHRVPEVIGYINSHVHRLSSLQFEFDYDDSSVHAALRGLNAPPTLRRLTIDRRGPSLPDPPEYTPGITDPIPSLRYLRLRGFPVTPELAQLRNLVVVGLDASYSTPRAVLDLLSRNPLLKAFRLWGRHWPEDPDTDNGHPPGSITLEHLEVLLLEMTPLVHLEALSPPHGARIFSGFSSGGYVYFGAEGGSYAASFPIPVSFSNLRDLRKLCLVDEGDIYVKLEGERGSITYRMSSDRPFTAGMFSGVPLEEVTDATYELSPLFWHGPPTGPTTSQLMVSRIVCGMVRLQKLELSCSAKEVEYFLLVLYSSNVCRDLKILVLSHCVELYRRMGGLVLLAEGRKTEGIGLDIVRIIHSNMGQLMVTFKQADVTRLESAVGTLQLVEAGRSWSGRSSLRFDPELGISQPSIF